MLKYRAISGVILGAGVVLAVLFCPLFGALLMFLVLSAVAQVEFYALVEKSGIAVYRWVGVIGGWMVLLGMFAAGTGVGGEAAGMLALVVLGLVCMVIFVRQFPQKHNDRPVQTVGVTLLGVAYVPLLLGFTMLLAIGPGTPGLMSRLTPEGRSAIMFLILVVKAADIGAYFAGRAFGRVKLFPRISPGKTWEGLGGGCAVAIVVGIIAVRLMDGSVGGVRLNALVVACLACALTLVGVVGDIFESLVKRAALQKDSSDMIPGMGGLLDVLDSLLFTGPVLYAFLYVLC